MDTRDGVDAKGDYILQKENKVKKPKIKVETCGKSKRGFSIQKRDVIGILAGVGMTLGAGVLYLTYQHLDNKGYTNICMHDEDQE